MPETDQSGMWVLRTEGENPRTLRLPLGAVRTVGRGTRADFIVADAMMSRVHCRLSASESELVVEDLGSTNGTFVNGARVEAIGLEVGDHLRIARSEFNISRDPSPSTAPHDGVAPGAPAPTPAHLLSRSRPARSSRRSP